MGTPITKSATVKCDAGGEVDLSAINSNLQVDGSDVVDAADVGRDKAPISNCSGHGAGSTKVICKNIISWNILLNTLLDNNQPVAGSATPPKAVATSNAPTAVITCTNPGNSKLFAN